MRLVIQRVKEAKVEVASKVIGEIAIGFLVLIGIENADNSEDIDWLVRKLINMRVFPDNKGMMNKSALDAGAEYLLVSQFTLHASTKKGNRPSFIKAAKPDIAIPLYQEFIDKLKQETKTKVETGEFGADMKVHLVNDGPVTLIIDSKTKE